MAIPFAAVVVGALGAVVTKVFELVYQFFAYKLAKRIAIGAGAITAAAALTLTMAQAIKAALLLARVSMPQFMAIATYFLPANINQIIAVGITIASARFLWSWSMKNLARFTQTVY